MSFGGTVACAMELFETGLIPPDETGGLDLGFGRADALDEARPDDGPPAGDRRPAGRRVRPAWPRPAAEPRILHDGQEARDPGLRPARLVHPGPRLHDVARRAPAISGAATPSRWPSSAGRRRSRASASSSRRSPSGTCRTTASSRTAWASAASPATPSPSTPGPGWSAGRRAGISRSAELEEIANRVAALERLFNIEAGATAADDDLPARFSERSHRRRGQGAPHLARGQGPDAPDYYGIRHWDADGRPSRRSSSTP